MPGGTRSGVARGSSLGPCQVAGAGDFFVVPVAADSMLVIRGEDEILRAMFSVCRHRGVTICEETSGRANKMVCPYHREVSACSNKEAER